MVNIVALTICLLKYGLLVSMSGLFLGKLPAFQRLGMRFFRDIGRIKSRNRLIAGSHNALAMKSDFSLLFGREQPLQSLIQDNGVYVDVEELMENDGSDGRPIWLAVKSRVYDVSAGAKFYGVGRRYHIFVGKDATRAFTTGCLKTECLISSLEGLSEKQRREADRWLE
jgi:predicted heme/steroid binding protein